jgi:hypothetical protein
MSSPVSSAQGSAGATELRNPVPDIAIGNPTQPHTTAVQPETQLMRAVTQTSVAKSLRIVDSYPESSTGNIVASTDLWSAAFREAVDTFESKMSVDLITGGSLEQLFKDLQSIDKSLTDESTFLRGLGRLRSMKVPLETFKLALDVTNPLASFEPTAATVFGVVRGVTTVRSSHDNTKTSVETGTR